MKLCTKCVMPDTFPGVTFNEEGLCNHCEQFESFAATPEQKAEYREKLMLLSAYHNEKNPHGPHVLMAYSGGKDSTKTIEIFLEYGFIVEAFTFDNGYISEQAWKNIKTVCNRLGVEHHIVKHPQSMMNDLFVHASTNDMYPKKTLAIASSICTVCSGFFKSAAMAYALDHRIPLIGYGWSPGQAPIQSAMKKANPKFVKMAQGNAIKPVAEVVGDEVREYFLQERHYDIPEAQWPMSVHPLAFEPYDENEIKEDIKKLGWVAPTDVDTNSTNCWMNAYANQSHIDRHGYHPYVMEVSSMVRQGIMPREEAMEKIYTKQDSKLVFAAKDALDEHMRTHHEN